MRRRDGEQRAREDPEVAARVLTDNWGGGRNWYGIASLARLRAGLGDDEPLSRGLVVSMRRAATPWSGRA